MEVIRSFFGPKGSMETKVLKNSCFHRDNRFWPVFRRIIECKKPQEAIYTGPQATLTLLWKLWKVSLGPKRLLKTQFFGKKAKFPVKKKFWPIFSRIFECEKPRGSKSKDPKGIPAFNVEAIISLL